MNDKSVEGRASGVVHRGDERQKCWRGERVVSFIGVMNDKSVEGRASGVVHKVDERQTLDRISHRWSSKARMMKPSPIESPQTFFRTPNQSKYKKSNIHKEEKIP
ncbi:hypothetical protein M3676_14635 [Metabacillus litoralis]|nr:hypothetical protein [Metabacillus litoralis]